MRKYLVCFCAVFLLNLTVGYALAAPDFEATLKAAEQGDVEAQGQLGALYSDDKDEDKAAYWWYRAGEQGDRLSQLFLGSMATRGNIMAQLYLGFMYANGLGVPQNDRKAFEWFQKAAEQGDADAQARLGGMYYKGQGVIRDRQKGCALFRAAGEQGYEKAIEFYNEFCNPN